MQRPASSLCSWAKAIKRALDASGVDSLALFKEAGLDTSLLDDPEARYPLEGTSRLWRLAVAATGDCAFGLRAASEVTPTTFHALGFTIIASATLREAFEHIVRYHRMATDASDLQLQRIGDEYHFRLEPRPGLQPADEATDAFVSIYVRSCRSMLGRDYSPLRIELRRPLPPDTSRFDAVLRTPITYGAAHNLMVFDRQSFERPLTAGNPQLVHRNDEIIVDYLARFDRDDVRTRVEAELMQRLPQGEPSQETIAQALCMSPRSLQRRLADAGTTYKALLDETRRRLALSYLSAQRYPVGEIAYLLGFADTSSFSRAFKRWTAASPREYRETR